jgi:hypothetical protein
MKVKIRKPERFCLFLIAGLVILIVGLRVSLIPPYTNMTIQESVSQWSRINASITEACENAGGQWIKKSMSVYDSFCSVSYQQPDFSWYVEPIANPPYAWGFPIAVTCSIFGVAVVLATLIFGIEISRKKKEEEKT